jgi:6-phosphofructo-2-kinase/fructose-2,6-biphosphatase 4
MLIALSSVQSGHSLIEHSFKADSDLSPQGEEYAVKLRDFIVAKRKELRAERIRSGDGDREGERRLTVRPFLHSPFLIRFGQQLFGLGDAEKSRAHTDPSPFLNALPQVWTSARRRCISTSRPMAQLGYKVIQRQQMYELNMGDVDGLSTAEIQERYPDEWKRAQEDPYAHRYPRAESYHDLSVRCVFIFPVVPLPPSFPLFSFPSRRPS